MDDEVTKPGGISRSDRRALQASKLQFPLPMVITLVATVLSVSGAWWKLSAHAESKTVHLNEQLVVDGGGVAYKLDIAKVQHESEQRLRRMLVGMRVTCRFTKPGMESVCSIALPELE